MEEEVLTDNQVQTGGPDPLEKLYKGLKEEKLYTNSFDEFKAKYSTPEEIKKLYDGLSELKLYTNSEDDFRKKYFPAIGAMAKEMQQPTPTPKSEEKKKVPTDVFGTELQAAKDEDVVALAQERKKMKSYGDDLRVDVIDKQLKLAGYDPDEVQREFSDLPAIPGFNPKEALQLKKDNPYLYDRKLGAIKSQSALTNAVEKKEGAKAAGMFLNNYVAGEFAKDYKSQRIATKQAVDDVHKYMDDADEQHKTIAALIADKGYGYGIGLPGQDEAIANDPRSQYWNPYQVKGMHFLEDLDPATAKSFSRLLSFTPEEIAARKNDTSFMRGWEAKSRELENIGMNLEKKAYEEKMTTMMANKKDWTPQDQQTYNEIYDKYLTLNKDMEGQRERYPAMAVMDADQAMQDALGESKRSLVARTVLGIGENVDDAKNWFGSLMMAPFTSDKEEAADDLSLLGDKRMSALNQYDTKGEELFVRGVNRVFKGDLKKEIDRIKEDNSLTDEEKQNQITGAIIKDNRKNVEFVPNADAGKMNFTGRTILNSVSKVASDILPQIALAYMTGGGAGASAFKEYASLFGSTFTTSYMDHYNDALEKNIANPTAYATTHTTIDAATELIGNNMTYAKKLFGGSVVGKILEKEGSAALSKAGRFSKVLETMKSVAKEGVKDSFTEGLEEGTGALLGNVTDKYAFGQDVPITDDILKSFVTTAVGMLPLSLLGLPGNYRKINQMQQYAIYESGMNPQKYSVKVDEDLASGAITKEEADKRKNVISQATAAVAAMPKSRADGSSMTDNEKAKWVANQIVLNDIAQADPGASKEIKTDLDLQKELIEAEQKQLITPPAPRLDMDTIEENRREEVNAARKQYKGMPREFQQQQLEKINAKYEDQVKEYEKQQEEQEKKEEEKNKQEKTEANAVQEQSPAGVPVPASPGNSQEVGKGNEGEGAVNEETTPKEVKPIETEEDLIKELENVKQLPTLPNNNEGVSAQPEGITGGVQGENAGATESNDQGVQPDGTQNLPGGITKPDSVQPDVRSQGVAGGALSSLPKLADQYQKVSKESLGIGKNDTTKTVLDKLSKIDGPFKPLFQFMEKTDIMKKVRFENYEPGKNKLLDSYLQHLGADPNALNGIYASEKKMSTAHETIRNTFGNLTNGMYLFNPDNAYYTMAHELMHAVTLDNISGWKKFTTASQSRHLEDIYKFIKANKPPVENITKENYGLHSIEEFLVESLINPEFRDYVKDVVAKSPQEFTKTTQDKGRDFIKVITDMLTKLLDFAFKRGAYSKGLSEKPLIDQAVDIGTKLFLGGNESLVNQEQQGRGKQVLQKQPSMGVLSAMPASQQPKTQEEAIKDIIKRTSKNISDNTLVNNIVSATGLEEQQVRDWMDEVRNPPPPPPPPRTTAQLSDEEKNQSLNKFNRLFDYQEPKKPSWFKKTWESLKNASALIDNPYRYVTKITEDINEHYDTKSTEVIPLGRAFEKSAAGPAALATQKFTEEVVGGNIGGEKLGKLKGEKYDDFQKYMAAKRVIDRLDSMDKKRQQGEQVNKRTGNITRQDAENQLAALEKKYGNLDDFTKRGEAFQRNMDDMLTDLVMSGNLSKEAYDEIKKDNDFYAPFSIVRSQMPVPKQGQGPGIAGIVKRIKGIGFELQLVDEKGPVPFLNDLAHALDKDAITPEEYFQVANDGLRKALEEGKITQKEYEEHIADLETPGFQLKDMLDAAANMIYRSKGMALKNTMMQRLYAYKEQDKKGLFIQDTDYLKAQAMPDGSMRMVTKPLDQIDVEEGMAPVRLKLNGKDVVVAINKYAADKINGMNNSDVGGLFKLMNLLNKAFRFFVITSSPGFQLRNFIIDATRTAMVSRYGPLAGKGIVEPVVNALMYIPQYLESFVHATAGNLGAKSDTFKQWMNSESFSRGMYDQLFNEDKEIKDIGASQAKKILHSFLTLKFLAVPGTILEETHKLAIYQRGSAIEGLNPEMATAKAAKESINMLKSLFNQHVNENMTKKELSDAMDRLNYEVQNYAGSPNFAQTHKSLKVASMFLQFFSARIKGEMSDYRRVANIFTTKGEGVKLSKQDRAQLALQFSSIATAMAIYAIKNNLGDDDEKEFNTIPSYAQMNYLNVPAGKFIYKDDQGNEQEHQDFTKIPLRGLTASMNVMANEFVKFYKHNDPESFKNMATATLANASPLNLSGKDGREYGESVVSNMTPVYKYLFEWSFNRDTHAHRDIVYPYQLLRAYRDGAAKGWQVSTPKTPEWCKDFSKFLLETIHFDVSAAEIDHMEKTMGSPSKLYNEAARSFKRSDMPYPVQQQPQPKP